MRRMLLAGLFAAALVLLLPFALAEGERDGSSGDGVNAVSSEKAVAKATDSGEADDRPELVIAPAPARAREKAEKAVAAANRVINKSAFAKLREEEKAKLEKLSPKRLERISSLKAENVEKLKDISRDRLRVISSLEPERLKKFAELKKEELEKAAKLDRSRVKELAQLSKPEIEAKLKKIKVVEADEGFRLRSLTLEQAQRSERAFEQLKENEAKLREKYGERMEKLRRIKERVRSCKDNPGAENCANATAEAIEQAKEAALNAAERITNHLEEVRERVEGSQELTEEEVADKAAKIDALIGDVSSIKADVEAASTKGELNAAVEKMKEIMKRIKSASIAHTNSIIRAQTVGVIHRLEVTEKKADCSLSSLEEQGTDTSAIDSKLDEYASLITTARQRVQEAKEVFNAEDKAAVEQSKALAREARESVKGAQEKLNEIRKDIRALGGEICAEKQGIAIEEESEE